MIFKPQNEPPVPHMEALTITQVAARLQMPEETVLSQLGEKGMPTQAAKQTLAEFAKQHRRTPQEVYAALQAATPPAAAPAAHAGAGMGLRVKTVADVASELCISAESALARLKQYKIQAQPQDTTRTVASNANVRPFDVVELLKQAVR